MLLFFANFRHACDIFDQSSNAHNNNKKIFNIRIVSQFRCQYIKQVLPNLFFARIRLRLAGIFCKKLLNLIV